MYTYFAFSSLEEVKTIDRLSKLSDKWDIKVGGIIPLVAVNALLKYLQFNSNELARRLNPEGPNDFQLYSLPENFISRLSAYGLDHLDNIAARWAKEEYWEMVKVNPFDLYGFLIEFRDYCKTYESKAGRIICAITAD